MRKKKKIVFISSAQVELQDERDQLRELINKNDDILSDIFIAKTFEVDLSGRKESVSEIVNEWVLKSDVYLGIFDREHSLPTEAEYYLAVRDKVVPKEIIIFIRNRKKSERQDKLNIFLKKVKDAKEGHSCIIYSNQANLLTKVKKTLMAYFYRSVEGCVLSQKMFGPKLDGLRGTNFPESLRRKLLKPIGRCINQTIPEPYSNSTSHSATEMTRYERFIKWCKNNQLICGLLIVFIIVIGLGHFTDAYNKIRDSWFKTNSSTSQDVSVEISEISVFDEDRRTQLRPRIKKRIDNLYNEIDNESLKPWLLFNIGKPVRVTKHDGSIKPYEGVRFEGAPRLVFWSDDFIPPIIENAIVKAFDQTTEECRVNGVDPKPHIYETNLILADLIVRVYNRMAYIDSELSSKGTPKNAQRKDVKDKINKMNESLKRYYKAAIFLASEN